MSIEQHHSPETKEEREAGLLRTGEMNAKRFGEHMGIAHGNIKRWLGQGLPARRTPGSRRVWIDPVAGSEWVEKRYPNTIARNRKGLIYVVTREDGAVKIGWTSDVMRRVHELRKENRTAVELEACFPGNKPDELRWHAKFSKTRLDGEWFGVPGNEVTDAVRKAA